MEPEFDFGPVLARGQTLQHDFLLFNPTDRPIRLLRAEALTPCCSSIGPVPAIVPPGGRAVVPVRFKTGSISGPKRVAFAVQTDLDDRPVWHLAVAASLMGEVEIDLEPGSDTSLMMGRDGRQTYTITCRRLAEEGRDAPTEVDASPPLSASFLGPPEHRDRPGGLVETTRKVEVDLPAVIEPGFRRSEVRLRWPGGQDLSHTVSWQVTPCLRATPSGLFVRRTRERLERTVVLRSDDRPVRVIGLSGPSLAEGSAQPPEGWHRTHRLHLVLDPMRVDDSQPTLVRILTDHPVQPAVTLSALVLPDGKGATE